MEHASLRPGLWAPTNGKISSIQVRIRIWWPILHVHCAYLPDLVGSPAGRPQHGYIAPVSRGHFAEENVRVEMEAAHDVRHRGDDEKRPKISQK